MLVMKFGGTSVADADRIRNAAQLALREDEPVVVVTSALGGVTDALIRLGEHARCGRGAAVAQESSELRRRHLDAIEGVTPPGASRERTIAAVETRLGELERLLDGIGLVQEVSPRSSDLLVAFGERLAAPIVAAAVRAGGLPLAAGDAGARAERSPSSPADAAERAGGRPSEPVDAVGLIVMTGGDAPGGPVVNLEASRTRSRDALLALLDAGVVPVVTGFVAGTADGRATTLGRGGSDYTATLLGAFLAASAVVIWTDVDGVMTADPRVVPEARVLPAVTYREAAEMAYFGSKVLHPRTMIPAIEAKTPVFIRNSFRPDAPGTRISGELVESVHGVKTVTSVPSLALVTVEGNGMIGVPGVARRVFQTSADAGINVYMVSQASSEHNISIVVHRDDADRLVQRLDAEFRDDVVRRQIDRIRADAPVGIVAVIGEGMKGRPGVSQRLFTALGRARINVLAIAQGSSELNLSVVVDEGDLQLAVGAAHSRFGLTRDTHLFVFGKGLVGRALLTQITSARRRLAERYGLGVAVIGVCGRTEWIFDAGGLPDETIDRIADGAALTDVGGEPRPADDEILARIAASRWLDVIVVDVTAEDSGDAHAAALRHGYHVVTANKKPMSGGLDVYERILAEAARHGVEYRFETTFGAGLPALSTLQDLIATCDEVHAVTGCFSGTLGFICSALDEGRPFSEAVVEARRRGFTEPDPRDDLSGLDVARKALIIARQLGSRVEMSDVALQGLIPARHAAARSADAFLEALPALDDEMAARARDARMDGGVLRYVAEITADFIEVGLRAVPGDSPAGRLSGPDNILVFRTERYHEQPLVIRGPGAGAQVTAAGVLGDVLKIVRAT